MLSAHPLKRSWVFTSKISSDKKVTLLKISDTPIRRHTKIKADANPYDVNWRDYFDTRMSRTKKMISSISKENHVLLTNMNYQL